MLLNLSESRQHTLRHRFCEGSVREGGNSCVCLRYVSFLMIWRNKVASWEYAPSVQSPPISLLDRAPFCLHKPGWPQGVYILREFNRGFWCLTLSGNLCRMVFLMMIDSHFWLTTMFLLRHTFDYIIFYSYLKSLSCCISLPVVLRRKSREGEWVKA